MESKAFELFVDQIREAVSRFTWTESREYELDSHDLDDCGQDTMCALFEGDPALIHYLFAWDCPDSLKYGYIRAIVRKRIADYMRRNVRQRGNQGAAHKIPYMCDAGPCIVKDRAGNMINVLDPLPVPELRHEQSTLISAQWQAGNYDTMIKDLDDLFNIRFSWESYIADISDRALIPLLATIQKRIDGIPLTKAEQKRIDRHYARIAKYL